MLLSGRGTRAALWVAITAALLLTALTARAAAVTYESEPAFCKRQFIVDPVSPFARMPKLHSPAADGRIGFGPERLRLRITPPLQTGGSEIGFTLAIAQRKGLSLPWKATTTIVDVNGNGRPIGKPRRMTKKVGWLKPFRGDRFQFAVAGDPAFYRTTILLSGASEQRLGRYSFYTRVARPIFAARLSLNAATYRPENTVFFRVENLGTLSVAYGVPYSIERLEPGGWIEAPESPDGPWILPILMSLPGFSGPCAGFWIPPTMPAGHYRVVKPIGIRDETNLTAEFDIAS
jgi:Big-like domain-containing protein